MQKLSLSSETDVLKNVSLRLRSNLYHNAKVKTEG